MKQSTRCLKWLQFLISRCISIWFFGDLRGRFTQSHMVHPNPSKLICLSRLTVQKLGFQTEALPLQSSASKQGTKAKKAPGIIELHQKETKPKKVIRSWGGQLDMSGTIAFKRWHHLTSGAGSVGHTTKSHPMLSFETSQPQEARDRQSWSVRTKSPLGTVSVIMTRD